MNLLDRRTSIPLRVVDAWGDRVDVVGAERERDLRELRPVKRPIYLNRGHVVGDQPGDCNALYILITGCRLSGFNLARKRRERAYRAELRLMGRDFGADRRPRPLRPLVDREPRQLEPGVGHRFK